MLRIYEVVLDVIVGIRPVADAVARRDADLAAQMRRAMSSVALNVAEGSYSRGKNRGARYHTAMGSMRETLACVEVGVAWGYVDGLDAGLKAKIDRVMATLYKVAV